MAVDIRIVFLLVLAATGLSFAAPAAAAPPAIAAAVPGVPTVPVVELGRGGGELPAPRRRAVEQALLAAADASGVVVCRAGTALSQPDSPALDRACAEPGLPRLWWDAEIGTEKTGDVFVLDVVLRVAIGGPTTESPVAIVPPHVLLPGGLPGEEGETAVLDGIARSLLAADELRSWLAGLKARPELLRAAGSGSAGASPGRLASAAERRAWDRELDQIADLLIDGRYLEGRDRAARLLREDLPPEIAERARELRVKAETRLAHSGSTGNPGTAPGAPGERGQIEIRPARPNPPKRQRWERGFDVRVARDDRGFAGGVDGRLAVSEEGVAFTRKGASRPDWSIAWADLAAAHRADGLWDVPYPLAIAEKGGRLHHLVRVDAEGKPLSGGAILSALAEGRLRSRKGYE